MDILTRLDACAECEQAPLAPLLADAAAEIRMLRRDAERYRWLAQQFRMAPDMGGNHRWWGCQPRPELRGRTLDAAIDAAMKGANT